MTVREAIAVLQELEEKGEGMAQAKLLDFENRDFAIENIYYDGDTDEVYVIFGAV